MTRIGLGLDTGGTYTDAVIMDLDTGEVLSKSKSMTTYGNLCRGIGSVIDHLDGSLLDSVGVVALSSTLATNSVVEGRGCRVGLICIGREYDRAVEANYSIVISGGNDVHGDPEEPLGLARAEEFMRSIKGKVEGLAVSGFLSVRNPEQELAVKELARKILNVPVVCGHELTSELGFHERTTTCIMNSRLIPVMNELIASVEKVLDERGIKAPLMISRGDGSMMSDVVARERPVETVLSGPAASLMGAMHMTNVKDAVVMDIGGTTTDIGILRNGHPGLDAEGALIGGKRTRVMAARIYTYGIGGDSRIVVNHKSVVATPQRVVPLCKAAMIWPSVRRGLDSLRKKRPGYISRPLSRPELQELGCEYLFTVRMPPEGYGFSDLDMRFMELVSVNPLPLEIAAMELGCNSFEIDLQEMIDEGFVQRVGFTPTDLLHITGEYTEFDEEASMIGAEYLSTLAGLDMETFLSMVRRTVRNRISRSLMDALVTEDVGEHTLDYLSRHFLEKAINASSCRDFDVRISLDKPIVGIGAPSAVYLEWVADVLGAQLLTVPDSDVGNAVGAVCASVSESIKYVIRPLLPRRSDMAYETFSKLGRKGFMSLEEACDGCKAEAKAYLDEQAVRNNADVVDMTVETTREVYAYHKEEPLYEVTMVVTMVGKPKLL